MNSPENILPSLLDKGKPKKRRITNNHSLAPADPQNDSPPPQIDSTPPKFVLAIPRCPLHSAYDLLPVRTQYQQDVGPADIWNLLLTTRLIERITLNTNTYHSGNFGKRARGTGSRELLAGPLRVWLGISEIGRGHV